MLLPTIQHLKKHYSTDQHVFSHKLSTLRVAWNKILIRVKGIHFDGLKKKKTLESIQAMKRITADRKHSK